MLPDEEVELPNRAVVILHAVERFAEPVAGIWDQAGLGVESDIAEEAGDRKVVVASRIVVQGVLIQLIRRRRADHRSGRGGGDGSERSARRGWWLGRAHRR